MSHFIELAIVCLIWFSEKVDIKTHHSIIESCRIRDKGIKFLAFFSGLGHNFFLFFCVLVILMFCCPFSLDINVISRHSEIICFE